MSELLKIVLLSLCFLSKAGMTLAQTIPLLHYSVKDGLPSNTIYSIARDSKGFLWFSSDKGISRFDGIHFQNYSTYDGLPDNEIFNIKEDYSGRLWFATYNGNLCYYQNGVFHTESNTPWLKLPVKSPIFSIFLQPDSSLIFELNDPRHFINIKGNQVRRYKTVVRSGADGKNKRMMYVGKISSSRYQLMFKDEIIDIDTSGQIKSIKKYKKNAGYFYASISFTDQNKKYLVGENGIYTPDEELMFPLNKVRINRDKDLSIPVRVRNNNFFIGLINGLNINDRIDINLGKHVTYIEPDLSENIWAATYGIGLYCFSKHFKDLKQYTGSYEKQVVYAKIINGTLFYVNTEGKLYLLKNGKVKRILNAAKGKRENEEGYLLPGSFLISNHNDFFQLFNKNFLVASGINSGQLKMRNDIAAKWEADNDEIIKEILSDDKYIYLRHISSADKILYKDFISKNIQGKIRLVDLHDKQKERILANALDKDGHYWFSTLLGLSKVVDDRVITLPHFKNIAFRQFGFYGDYLIGITQNNKFIISNNYNGAMIADSLQSDNCIWENIYRIDDHHAIISTNNFNRLLTLYPGKDKSRPQYELHAIEDPFIPVQSELIAADTQNCYFFKEGVLTQIATRLLFEKALPPVPIFETLRTTRKSYSIRPGEHISISYEESENISISFANIAFEGKDLICQYTIAHDNADHWNKITGNEINLNAPGYGTHVIKIRTSTLSSGFCNPVVITLTILRPFWATWWFIIVVIVILLVMIWLAVVLLSRRKVRKQQKEHDADMKYQQSEYKALNALMNPHFIFNSLNNIQGLINKNDKRVANEYLVIFSDLVRQNMHNISKGFITLQEELTLVENYLNLEKLRFKEYISYSITVAEDVETDLILIPPLMIQPLVENAVKHGLLPKQSTDNSISVKVFESLDKLYIEIADNGVGLTYAGKNKSNLHQSFGLSNLQKRADHLKKIQKQEINVSVIELLDEQGKVLGTKATVTMELS